MDDSINVIKRDSKVQLKIKDMFDKYNRLPYNYQSQNRILYFESKCYS